MEKILDVRGQYDYIPNEFVFVAFESQDNQEILEFGMIEEVRGDQYLIKLLTKNGEIAVVTRAAIRMAGIA